MRMKVKKVSSFLTINRINRISSFPVGVRLCDVDVLYVHEQEEASPAGPAAADAQAAVEGTFTIGIKNF